MAEAVIETAMADGKLYAIPFTHNTFFMYYDKSLLSDDQIKSMEGIMAAETPTTSITSTSSPPAAGSWAPGTTAPACPCLAPTAAI